MPHYKPKPKKTPKVRRPVKRGGGPSSPIHTREDMGKQVRRQKKKK